MPHLSQSRFGWPNVTSPAQDMFICVCHKLYSFHAAMTSNSVYQNWRFCAQTICSMFHIANRRHRSAYRGQKITQRHPTTTPGLVSCSISFVVEKTGFIHELFASESRLPLLTSGKIFVNCCTKRHNRFCMMVWRWNLVTANLVFVDGPLYAVRYIGIILTT